MEVWFTERVSSLGCRLEDLPLHGVSCHSEQNVNVAVRKSRESFLRLNKNVLNRFIQSESSFSEDGRRDCTALSELCVSASK